MNLSTLAVILGVGYGLPHLLGLARPESYRDALRRFPRSAGMGWVLMAGATAWFLWNLHQEDISDFAQFKPVMFLIFAAIGLGACVVVRDFLAVRGLAIVFMLLAKLMVDTARLVDSDWRLVVVCWAYLLVLAGVWFTVSPWRLRDWIEWSTGTVGRIRGGCFARLVVGFGVAALGVTVFRGS